MNILAVKNMTKKYGKIELLKDININLVAGDIMALIGPNGSGKTTIMKIILGLQKLNSGKIIINGYDVEKDFIKAINGVGALIEYPDFYTYISGYQNLKLMANIYPKIDDRQINDVLELVDLSVSKDQKVGKYSLGMKQRLGIARAIINKPKLLILDEPTNGLDPKGIKELRLLLQKLAKTGVAILISSHNLLELECFCNKVCILKNGSALTIENLKTTKYNTPQYKFIVSNVSSLNLKSSKIISKFDNYFIFEGNKHDVAAMVRYIVANNIEIYRIELMKKSLEDTYLALTGVCK